MPGPDPLRLVIVVPYSTGSVTDQMISEMERDITSQSDFPLEAVERSAGEAVRILATVPRADVDDIREAARMVTSNGSQGTEWGEPRAVAKPRVPGPLG